MTEKINLKYGSKGHGPLFTYSARNISEKDVNDCFAVFFQKGTQHHTRFYKGDPFQINRIYRADQKRYYYTMDFK